MRLTKPESCALSSAAGELFEGAFQERALHRDLREQPPLFAPPLRDAKLGKARIHRLGGLRHFVDGLAGGVVEARLQIVHPHRPRRDDGGKREAGNAQRDDGSDPAAHAPAALPPAALLCALLPRPLAFFRTGDALLFPALTPMCGLCKALVLFALFEALFLLLCLRLCEGGALPLSRRFHPRIRRETFALLRRPAGDIFHLFRPARKFRSSSMFSSLFFPIGFTDKSV